VELQGHTACPNTFDKFHTVDIHIPLVITTSLDSCGTRSVSCGRWGREGEKHGYFPCDSLTNVLSQH
jgi:hypothetical protein